MIAYSDGLFGVPLVFSEGVVSHFRSHRQRRREHREAGGQLFARVGNDAVAVVAATGPRPSDRRGPTSYIPDRWVERLEIWRMFRRRLHYVGDWHTHAEIVPVPSAMDIATMCDLFHSSSHELSGLVIVVVGQGQPPTGLFVGVCDGDGVRRLSPADESASATPPSRSVKGGARP